MMTKIFSKEKLILCSNTCWEAFLHVSWEEEIIGCGPSQVKMVGSTHSIKKLKKEKKKNGVVRLKGDKGACEVPSKGENKEKWEENRKKMGFCGFVCRDLISPGSSAINRRHDLECGPHHSINLGFMLTTMFASLPHFLCTLQANSVMERVFKKG